MKSSQPQQINEIQFLKWFTKNSINLGPIKVFLKLHFLDFYLNKNIEIGITNIYGLG